MSADDSEAILDVVADLFEPGGFARATTGELRANAEFQAKMTARLLIDRQQKTVIETLGVTQMSDGDAVVELVAVSRYRVRAVDGRRGSGTHRFTGPVVLVNEEGEWKVVDLMLNGRSMRRSMFASSLTGSTEGVDVRVLGGLVLSTETRLFVEIHNDLGRALRLVRAAIATQGENGRWRWVAVQSAADEVPEGTTGVEFNASLGAVADAPFRLLVRTDAGTIDVRPEGVAPQRGFPASVRFPQGRFLLAVVVLLAGLTWIDSGAFAGVALALFSALTLAPLLRHVRHGLTRPLVVWLLWVGGAMVAGVLLALTAGGTRSFTGAYDAFDSWAGLGVILLFGVGWSAIELSQWSAPGKPNRECSARRRR